MFKNIFENISPFAERSREQEIKKSLKKKQEEQRKRSITRREADKNVDMAKRNFLITGAKTVAAVGAAIYIPDIPEGISKISNGLNKFFDPEDDNSGEATELQTGINKKDEEVFDEVAKKEILDKVKKNAHEYRHRELDENDDEGISLEEEFSFAKEKIELNAEKIQDSLRGEWLDYYGVGGRGHNDLINAYSKMQAYINDFREAFQKEGVPEKFLYLAIPESHFDMKAKSGAGAVGPYQFTIETAEEVGLAKVKRDERGKIVEIIYDYRKDPVKSAEACAKYLRKKYNQCGDWRLAVAAYNGIVGKYFLAEDNKEERDYNSFVKFIENDLNKKKELAEGDYYEYKVRDGNSLSGIAKFFNTDIDTLRKENNIPENSSRINVGQMLKIKLDTTDQRIALFEKLANIKGLGENFNYPAKFEAVWQLIKDAEGLRLGKNPLFKDDVFKKAKLDREKKSYYTYTVKDGDTLYGIAARQVKERKLKMPPNELVKIIVDKNKLKTNNIKPKQELIIPVRV